jgi:hypothetical protein
MATSEANHYVLEGGGVTGTVDTTSFGGAPQLNVEVDGTSLQDPTLEETARGLEVTGVLSVIPDDRTVSATVFLPRVNIGDAPSVAFSGIALVTTALQSFGGPNLVSGAVHSYAVRPVAGTAQSVEFLAGGGTDTDC